MTNSKAYHQKKYQEKKMKRSSDNEGIEFANKIVENIEMSMAMAEQYDAPINLSKVVENFGDELPDHRDVVIRKIEQLRSEAIPEINIKNSDLETKNRKELVKLKNQIDQYISKMDITKAHQVADYLEHMMLSQEKSELDNKVRKLESKNTPSSVVSSSTTPVRGGVVGFIGNAFGLNGTNGSSL